MKRTKIALLALVVTCGLLISFSFTNGREKSKIFVRTYYFDTSSWVTSTIGSLDEGDVTNSSSWTIALFIPFCNSSKLAAITFNQQFIQNGGDDGSISLQEALDALWEYYDMHGNTLPSDNVSFKVGANPGTDIIVRRRQ